jgi:hypothetical protein
MPQASVAGKSASKLKSVAQDSALDANDDASLDLLLDFLSGVSIGPVVESRTLARLLADVWDSFRGSDEEGMTGRKLIGRMESVAWESPVLTFLIERHGGTVRGSTRGELHRWSVNVESRTASCETGRFRQLQPMAKRISAGLIAQEIAGLMLKGKDDARLKWDGDDKVRVEMGHIFPTGSGFKRTIEGRRKRLRESLKAILAANGWRHRGRNVFERQMSEPGGSGSMVTVRQS